MRSLSEHPEVGKAGAQCRQDTALELDDFLFPLTLISLTQFQMGGR